MSMRMDEEDWPHTLAVFGPAFRVADARPKTITGSSKRFISSGSKTYDGARCRSDSDTETAYGRGSTA